MIGEIIQADDVESVVRPIRISVDHAQKTVQVWCIRSERDSAGFWDRLQRVKGYKTIVFVSGTQPLAELTADILKHNII